MSGGPFWIDEAPVGLGPLAGRLGVWPGGILEQLVTDRRLLQDLLEHHAAGARHVGREQDGLMGPLDGGKGLFQMKRHLRLSGS